MKNPPLMERAGSSDRRQRPRESRPEPLQARDGARKHPALAIWTESSDPRRSVAEKYLAGRSLELPDEVAGEAIRFHSACPFGAERWRHLMSTASCLGFSSRGLRRVTRFCVPILGS
jgi:hypothetical protein